ELFEGWPAARMRLLGEVLESLELLHEGRVAMLRVTRDMLTRTGADDDMVEGMVNYGRMLRGVEISVLLWEFPGDGAQLDTKISLRSSGRADVAKAATMLDGG